MGEALALSGEKRLVSDFQSTYQLDDQIAVSRGEHTPKPRTTNIQIGLWSKHNIKHLFYVTTQSIGSKEQRKIITHNKALQHSWYCTLHSTFNHRTQTNTTSPKNFLKVLQLNANNICRKTDEIQLLIQNTHADVIAILEIKLNQSHKTPNIPHFTPIRTDCTYKQGGGLLTCIKNSISFLQPNTLNTSSIKLQKSSKFTFLHHRNNVLQNTCCKQYIANKCISNTLHLAITNRSRLNYIQHIYNHNKSFKHHHQSGCQCWYSPTKDYRGELIQDNLLNCNHITLNINTPTCLPPN